MKPLILTALLLLASPIVCAQTATVHFYRPKESSGLYPKTKTAIYVNAVKVASLGNNRIFAIDLEPGKFTFAARDKKEPGITLTLEAGKTYYVRGDMDLTRIRMFRKPNFRLTLVALDQAVAETGELLPVADSDIKDKRVRTIKP